MPTTAWSVARDEITRPLGFQDFATTTNIASNNSVISTELASRYPQNDHFNGWYLLIEDQVNVGIVRRVTDYVASTGTITVAGAVLGADSTAANCSLYLFHPTDIQRAYNRARQNVYPQIATLKDLHTIVTGQHQREYTVPQAMRRIDEVFLARHVSAESLAENVLSNPGFEDWTSGNADSWTVSGTGASDNEEESTTGPSNYATIDGSSARLVIPVSTTVTYLQTVTPSVGVEGQEINFSIWVYCRTASRISATIQGSDVVSTPVTGTAHTGTGWERLTVTANIDDNGTSFSVGVAATSGAVLAAYVDEAICVVGQSEIIDPEWEPVQNWRVIPVIDGASNAGKLVFPYIPSAKHELRIVGQDMLASVSTDASTFEIDGELLEPLYDYIRWMLASERAPDKTWGRRAAEYMLSYDNAINSGLGMSNAPRKTFRVPVGS